MPTQLPIVLLPGVMGSRLYFPQSRRFWDPDRASRMVWWAPVWPLRSDDDNRRALHGRSPAGVVLDTADVTADRRDRGWSTVIWSFYGRMLERLEEEFGRGGAFAVGYDWRQDIRWLGGYAAGKLRQVLARTGAEKIAVITHSMGGLVTRAALKVDPRLADRVAVVIHICQPSVGAVILYRRLFTGLVRGLDGGGGVGDRAFRLLLGNNQAAFLGNMSGLPGPMQLLPSRHFSADGQGRPWHALLGNGGMAHDSLYGNANSPPGLAPGGIGLSAEVLADLRDRIDDLDAFHRRFLGAPQTQPPPDTWLIYGTGLSTEMGIAFSPGAQPVLSERGDEVVPDLSATALQLGQDRMIAVPGVKHAEACGHPAVQDHVASILTRNGLVPVPAPAAPMGFAPAAPAAPMGFAPAAPAAPAAPMGAAAVAAPVRDAGPDLGEWLQAAGAVAARLGVRVRITVEVDPPPR